MIFPFFVRYLSIVSIIIVDYTQQFDVGNYLDPFDSHPRLLVKNGHLVLLTGRNKDIIFRSSGSGQIKINGNDLLASKIQSLNPLDADSDLAVPNQPIDTSIGLVRNKLSDVETKLNARIVDLTQKLNDSLKFQGIIKKVFGLKQFRRVRTLMKRLDRIEKLLKRNECDQNPCQNGATCEDGFNQYYCRCPPGFKGSNCEQDIDECVQYQGTELGCQNGGTCLNIFGGFHCLCPPNHLGVRCTIEFNDCRNVSDHEICGQGLCLNLPRTANNVARFRCVCYQGFTKSNMDDQSPCDLDVDECALGLDHCSRDPPVDCINTHDGYTCAQCPVGYSGDGFRCINIDRCLINNGGCSISPMVQCYNIPGRVACGQCPPGFVGDGITCSQVDGDICSNNNGGCSSNAVCVANTAISATFRECRCNPGFVGSGVGTQGCQPISSSSCAQNPCQNGGTCYPYHGGQGGVFCSCSEGFSGQRCEQQIDPCQRNPCLNGGQCINNHGVHYCICTAEFTGRDCEQPRPSCGGELDAQAGVLAYPPTNSTTMRAYANNVTCVWLIHNTQQLAKVFNVTITKFKIERSPGCVFDYLEIFDGPSREYKNLGKFCGEELPKGGNFITSFNSFYVNFRSDPSISHEGFELHWTTIDPACGGLIVNRTNGVLESPGYPHHYPGNRDCYWDIVADYGKRIQFIFTDLELENSHNCSFDYLVISEGLSRVNFVAHSNQIARFCNFTSSPEQSVPPPITTSGSFARVHFHSDAGIHSRGFHMVFNQVPGVCGGILTGSSGIFQSPSTSYTSSLTGRTFLVYQNNIVCDWLIRVMPNERISLRFLSFALEADSMVNRPRNQSGVCMFDYVEVYDGESFDSPLRARLCGRIIPPEIISTGRFLRVKFRSDMSVAFRGFIASYQALCGGEYDQMQGRIESPNFPAPSLVSKNCTFQINVPVDHIVELIIEEMDIEFDHRCLFDYLMIQDQRFCGQSSPPPFYSMNNELKIYYVNDDTKPSRGFRARYQAVEIGCGGLLKQGDPMLAISAERLTFKPFVKQCFWEIRANQSFVVMIKFYHIETVPVLQQHPELAPSDNGASMNMASGSPMFGQYDDCFDHYIMINDSDGSLIKRFCADQLPPPISSTGNKLFVTYVFNVTQMEDGWVGDSNNSSSNGTINASNMTVVKDKSGNIVEFTEHVRTKPPSTNIAARVPFRPKQFYATYHFLLAKTFCDKNLFKNTGVIRSPRFPRRYPHSRNCTWIIHVDNGLQIRLNFTQFRLELPSEFNRRCYDYLEIRNGRRPDSPLIGQFCGFGPMPDIVSHSNYLFLRFISDPSMQNKGFEVYYEAIATGCGGTMTAESGTIESPGFPDHYPSNANCEWKIRVAEGSVIVAYISQLDIERSSSVVTCDFDYLEVFDDEKSLGRYCNMLASSGPMIITKKNRMLLKFVTDASVNHGGFRLTYRTKCDPILVGRYGIIESPNYPDPHPHNLKCNWHILAPLGNNITIAFTQLVLENNVDCKFDHLNISEINRPQQHSLAMAPMLQLKETLNMTLKHRFCGNHTGSLPPLITMEKNEIMISFFSDETQSMESGFRLEWSAVGCGDEIRNRPYGIITSPNYPNPYPMNVECLWHIHAEPGHRVDLIIDDLDLEFAHGCAFDYLQVFSGMDDQESPSLTKLCNRASSIHLSSFGDSMTIKLVSDLTSSRRGFNATFRTTERGCGGTYFVEQGSIAMKNLNGNNGNTNTDCSYKLVAEDNHEVEVIIHDYHIPESINCTNSYLAIYDGYSKEDETKLLIKTCGLSNQEIKLRSNDSGMFVRFRLDGSDPIYGFNITYKKVCGKTIIIDDQQDYYELKSANYPHPFHVDGECRFLIRASKPENHVTIRFTHFDALQAYVDGGNLKPTCDFTHATIYEGDKDEPKKIRQKICSSTISPAVISEGDTLLLVATSSVFRALVSSIQSFCGGDFHAIDGFLSNPGFPNSYPLNIECIWLLETSPGNRFQLEFEDFDIEQSDYCNSDYLEIRLDNSSGLVIGDQRLCGNNEPGGSKSNIPVVQVDLPGNIWIKFRTDDTGVGRGFLLHFRIAHLTMLSTPEGLLGSPGWPNGFNFQNLTYIWYIVVPHNHYVKLEFIELQIGLDQFTDYCPMHLAIYNGIVDFSQMLPDSEPGSEQPTNRGVITGFQSSMLPQPRVTICGQTLPKNFIGDSNALTLMYMSNYLTYAPFMQVGFLLKWSTINATDYTTLSQIVGVPTDVNSTFNIFIDHGQKFNLLSTNFTKYGNDINWFFRTKQSMHLNVTVDRFNFDPQANCWANKMTFYTWNQLKQKWFVYRTVCNGLKEPVEVLGSNEFRIHLQHAKTQDAMPVRPIYNLTIKPICGGNFTGQPNGQIDSTEDIDEHVRGVKSCEWMIQVRQGRTIRIHVDFYSIGLSLMDNSCRNQGESLDIHNGHSADAPFLVSPICGHNTTWFTLPETSTNYAYVVFKSKRQTNYFRIRFEEVGIDCGGEFIIKKPNEAIIISSPGYPESPKHDLQCEWRITGPLDYGLQITFHPEPWSLCDQNNSYLNIYNGGSSLASLVQKVCIPSYNLNTISINSHVTLIRYVLKKVDFQSRFNATITVDSCNREYYVPFGGIPDSPFWSTDQDIYEFPRFPGMNSLLPSVSPMSTDICTIRLRTQANFYITLNVTSIQLQGSGCSSGDVIEMKDNEFSSIQIVRICPPRNETSIHKGMEVVSSSNELFITYKKINFNPNPQELQERSVRPVGIKFYASAKYKRCYQMIDVRNQPSGAISSPNYPKPISRRISCLWIFYNDPGSRIRLFFNWFELGELPPTDLKDKTHRCSKVLLISRNIFQPRNLKERYGCSKKKPKMVESLSHTMSIRMYANELNTYQGFSLVYSSINDNESCSDVWDSSHGSFQSSHFNNLNHTGLIGCAWEMRLGFNQSGSLVLDTFDVPGDCSNSTLTTGQLNSINKIFAAKNTICVPPNLFPQTTRTKFIVPIYYELDDLFAKNPTIFLNFNRTKIGSHRGISGEYFIQNCGGSFDGEVEREFKSPNYPNGYAEPTFCHWSFKRINADYEGDSIPGYKLTFLELDLGSDCSQDYFLMNPRYEWQGSEKICSGGRLPDPIYLTHDVLLSFVSSKNLSLTGSQPPSNDGRNRNRNRKFRFKIEPVSHGCGGLLVSPKGYFQSPNYSNDSLYDNIFMKSNFEYPGSIECIWTIKALPDFHLEFEFTSRFDLEQSDNCQKDYLQFDERFTSLIDGQDEWRPLAKLCGHRTPAMIVSQSDLVRVTFHTDEKTQGNGFRAQYRQKCGQILQDESGTIYSPHYSTQGTYSNELTCVYKIQRQPDEYIQLQFEDFDLEQHTNCLYDSLDIYLGDHTNQSVPHYGPYCGSLAPPMLSSQKLLTIVFHTDHFITKRGFKIFYNVTKCGGNLTEPEGLIVSPFDIRRDCVWDIILPDKRMSVVVEFLELDLKNEHCRYDCCNFLKVFEKKFQHTEQPLAYLCNNITQDVKFKSSSPELSVLFQRGYWGNEFMAKFRLHYWSSPTCGGQIADQSEGVIVSPDLNDDSFYEQRLDCIWIIMGIDSQQIVVLEFERFDVSDGDFGNDHPQDENRCIHGGDYLQIFDGTSLHSQQLAILCGRTVIPEKLVSTTNTMLIQFVTNQDNKTGHGFRARFHLENRTCGGTIQSLIEPSTFTSPGFPDGYETPLQCSWDIDFQNLNYRVPIVLKFQVLDLNCEKGDFVRIIQYRSSQYESFMYQPLTLCQSPSPIKIMTTMMSKVRLLFKTFEDAVETVYDEIGPANRTSTVARISPQPPGYKFKGFNLTHHIALCNETIDGPDNGFVASRNFPQPTQIHSRIYCSINITVAEDRQISLYFDQLSFYLCSHSNMTIYEGRIKPKVLATYCDQQTIPNPFYTTSNQISLLIQADYLLRTPGTPVDPHTRRNKILYSLSYTSVPKSLPPGCGGNFTSPRGRFASPSHPAPFMYNQMCQWAIYSSGYHTITLNFDLFRLAPTCEKHYVQVFDGVEDIEENLMATFCENENPAPIHSRTNALLIKYYSTNENWETGFQASYKTNNFEPSLKGRIITKDTFKFYRNFRILTNV